LRQRARGLQKRYGGTSSKLNRNVRTPKVGKSAGRWPVRHPLVDGRSAQIFDNRRARRSDGGWTLPNTSCALRGPAIYEGACHRRATSCAAGSLAIGNVSRAVRGESPDLAAEIPRDCEPPSDPAATLFFDAIPAGSQPTTTRHGRGASSAAYAVSLFSVPVSRCPSGTPSIPL
jgi:hypothetical protein